jgi:hypothetical protein
MSANARLTTSRRYDATQGSPHLIFPCYKSKKKDQFCKPPIMSSINQFTGITGKPKEKNLLASLSF